jgi:hypothetical protein
VGEKVWADAVISDRVIYIATLMGSIENINPCLVLQGRGKIYARYAFGQGVGTTAMFGPAQTSIEFVETKQKVRSAVTVGDIQKVSQEGQPTIYKRKLFIQSFTRPEDSPPEPPSQVLAQTVTPQSRLIIKSWREVYRVIK